MDEVTPMKMSQLRDGSFGRLSSQEVGSPVYLRAVRIPDDFCGATGGFSTLFSDMPKTEQEKQNKNVGNFSTRTTPVKSIWRVLLHMYVCRQVK